MAVFKCKMCGGDLEINDGITVAECEFCGTKQTVPGTDSEKKVNLFNRANRLRFNCEFDKASAIYENIIAEFPEEAEAYWGLCLCNYGIEYVDDPATARKIPTCHRASFERLSDDENFALAIEYADVVAQKVLRDEAREIDRITGEILAISKNEKAYDVFICYKETDEKGERTEDSVIAYDIYEALTAKGYKVFFSRVTLEDKLGMQYEPYIFAALNSAKVMLSIGTKYEYYHTVWVKNEWSRFLKLMAKDRAKVLVPCYKYIDAYDMPEEFKGLQAQDLGKLGAVQDIVRGVEKIIPKENVGAGIKETVAVQQQAASPAEPLLKRAFMFLEDGNWQEANTYCEKVLDMDPENADAYLGKLMAELKVNRREDLKNFKEPFDGSINYKKAVRFGNTELSQCNEDIKKRKAEKIQAMIQAIKKKNPKNVICAGDFHTLLVKADGTVKAAGEEGKACVCDVSEWKDIIAVAAGGNHTVGLKSDGTVIAAGANSGGQCNVSDWTDIVAVSARGNHTVGLKSSGTVVATGSGDVSALKDIAAVSAGHIHTVGLKHDGSVIAAGDNRYGECSVSDWTDIVAVSAGGNHTVGLKSSGTVVATGSDYHGQCSVSDWTDIVAVSAGEIHTVGLKSDGTVIAAGDNSVGECNVSDWTDIVAVSAGCGHTVGLKSDGSVVAVGYNSSGQTDVAYWNRFADAEEDRRMENEHRLERIKALEEEKEKLVTELSEIKGMFSGKQKKELKNQIELLNKEISKLKR